VVVGPGALVIWPVCHGARVRQNGTGWKSAEDHHGARRSDSDLCRHYYLVGVRR